VKLQRDSLEFAIKHIDRERDTDLYPRLFEHRIIASMKDKIVQDLGELDIGAYQWKPGRRFLIPKTDLSYRIATQLDPIDSIFFAGLIRQFGHLIEKKRRPISEKTVFSYRFLPTADGLLYDNATSWNDFWQYACLEAEKYRYVARLDISDFYNQIYHHTIENQLIECAFPNEVTNSIMQMLKGTTQNMSRGIPIGPHTTHLLAEATLSPLDNYFADMRYHYCRYVDDIIIFFNCETDARIAIYKTANQLDAQQRLVLQKSKTKIEKKDVFIRYASKLYFEEPEKAVEKTVLSIINKYSNNNPYKSIDEEELEEEEKEWFDEKNLANVIEEYLGDEDVNYSRIRWLYRRLAQIGIPTLVEYSIRKIEQLIPALSDICLYLLASAEKPLPNSEDIGKMIIDLMDTPIMKSNEFFRLSLLSVFEHSKSLNNLHLLFEKYDSSSNTIKRIIILAAYANGSIGWIRELKEKALSYDKWTLRSCIVAFSLLPKDERKVILKNITRSLTNEDRLEKYLIEWSKSQ